MRMKEPYEAYLDDYNCLDVYMSKNFFDGKRRIFHMKDTKRSNYSVDDSITMRFI